MNTDVLVVAGRPLPSFSEFAETIMRTVRFTQEFIRVDSC